MIESLQNEKIKYLARLNDDNRFRKKAGLVIVEGKQENNRAKKFNFEHVESYICEAIFKEELPQGKIHLISEKVYQKIAYRGSSEGIIGIYKVPENALMNFTPNENTSIVIVEGIEKPGNLGAILRSCEAFGIDALIITDPKTDLYNPNVIRSSVGCLFGMNVFTSTNEETAAFLEKNNIKTYSTFMSECAKDIYEVNFKKSTAIIFGTEHSGISDYWLDRSENILIPMAGTIDSLNLSNAVAISCYEILRQKKA
ncbi:TrmH family RNA methyltransferase [Amniculibacterium aquaticum]|jgi:TrmH family RNA methyltransferase|uniref:TrmH family RNA methyltransferase n=1 Tax=Amniculibacterium aquaticum TaxID=2479858 RepID=UPI0013DDDBCE|nr:RNA methyltransferase [Amniculibacterium aquaticum]